MLYGSICMKFKNRLNWDFPGSPEVKNLPCTAGDSGSIPGQGTKTPHASEQLSPCATSTEAHVLWSPRSATTEEVHHN